MLTEQTYLFNIFILFFAIIIVGYKMKGYSKALDMKKSSTKILVINDGKTGDLPSKIVKHLERYATVLTKDIKDYHIEELEAEAKNYSKIILVCKIGDRMELYQEKVIQDLDKQIQSNLQVFYLLNQGTGSYCVPDCRAIQTNISINDEKLLKENLKDLLEMTTAEKWFNKMKIISFFVGLLLLGSIYGYLQLKSGVGEAGENESLQARILQMKQSHADIVQENERLTKDNLKMKSVLQENKQLYLVLNEENVALSSDNNQLQDEVKELKGQNENLNAQTTELERKYQEMKDLYEQELKRNKALEKENLELKRLIAESEEEVQQYKKKLAEHGDESRLSISKLQEQFSKLKFESDEELKSLKQELVKEKEQKKKLEKRINEDFFCRLSSRIKDLFS